MTVGGERDFPGLGFPNLSATSLRCSDFALMVAEDSGPGKRVQGFLAMVGAYVGNFHISASIS